MHPPLRLVLLAIALTPATLVAQPASARPVPLTTDTLDLRLEQSVDAGGAPPPYTVRRIARGVGTDAGALVEVVRSEQAASGGPPALISVDSTIVGAQDFLFRRARTLRFADDGHVTMDARSVLRGRTIERRYRTESGKTDSIVHRTLAPTEALPVAAEVLYLQGAPLRVGWSARLTTYNGSADDYSTSTIDSVRLERQGTRTMWVAEIRPALYVRLQVTLDSATRAVVSMAITSTSSGERVATMRSRRFADVPTTVRATAKPRPSRAGRPGILDGTRAGVYYLQGEREVGSELALLPDGRFRYALAYGALDEMGEGRWSTTAEGTVVLQSDGVPHAPRVTLAKAIGRATDSVLVTVQDTAGRPINGIEVDFVQPRAGTSFRHARRGESVLNFDPADAPTEIAVGYDILNFMENFPLKRPPAASYRFVFDPGDLGRRRFEGESLVYAGDTLFMTRNGRRLRYVRH